MQDLSFVITTNGGRRELNLTVYLCDCLAGLREFFFSPNCQFERAVATSAA